MIINSKPTTETEYKGIPIFQNSPELIQAIKERGIKVARRTIAKYRSQIGVKSSYDR